MRTKKQPTHYYVWGNEPVKHVSTGYYDRKEVWRETDAMLRSKAEKMNLQYRAAI